MTTAHTRWRRRHVVTTPSRLERGQRRQIRHPPLEASRSQSRVIETFIRIYASLTSPILATRLVFQPDTGHPDPRPLCARPVPPSSHRAPTLVRRAIAFSVCSPPSDVLPGFHRRPSPARLAGHSNLLPPDAPLLTSSSTPSPRAASRPCFTAVKLWSSPLYLPTPDPTRRSCPIPSQRLTR